MDYICRPRDYSEWKMVKDTCNGYELCDVYYGDDECERTSDVYPFLLAEWIGNEYYIQGTKIPSDDGIMLTVHQFLNRMSGNHIEPISYCRKHKLV